MLVLISLLAGVMLGQHIQVTIDDVLINKINYLWEWALDGYTAVKVAIKPEWAAPKIINTEFDAIELQHRKQKATLNI